MLKNIFKKSFIQGEGEGGKRGRGEEDNFLGFSQNLEEYVESNCLIIIHNKTQTLSHTRLTVTYCLTNSTSVTSHSFNIEK
jgi:hypothetical protein